MKHSTSYEVLTNPTLPLDEGFRHMSYALFRTDDEDFGRVLTMRFPAREMLNVGDTIQSALHLSDEAVAYLLRVDDREPPLFASLMRVLACFASGMMRRWASVFICIFIVVPKRAHGFCARARWACPMARRLV